MNEQLELLTKEGVVEIQTITNLGELEKYKAKYLGKTGLITSFMQQLKNVAVTERKNMGMVINKAKNSIEEVIAKQKEFILASELKQKLATESLDISLDGRGELVGSHHPVYISMRRIIEIFKQMAFAVADGPEIETDYYNFAALNIPKNHPARAMQDTFYTQSGHIMRTHTSPVQVRYAEGHPPPLKVITLGRVYRVDMDATHTPMFHQLEGLWIDKGLSFANLKAVMINFLKQFFQKEDLQFRFRASYFPFTEPSAEIDILSDSGKWLEVAGCGMVHPNVLKHMNIDSEEYSGFACGFGIDRVTMLRYQIHDLRSMFENDLDFIKQFQSLGGV